MITKTENGIIVLDKLGVSGKQIFNNTKLEYVRLTIEPGHEIEKHALPFDVQFFVIDGEGILFIGEESISVKMDSLVICHKHVERAWKNLGSRNLELLVIKHLLP